MLEISTYKNVKLSTLRDRNIRDLHSGTSVSHYFLDSLSPTMLVSASNNSPIIKSFSDITF